MTTPERINPRLWDSFLKIGKVHVLPNPSYSPDLSPWLFFLFLFKKNHLSGRRYALRKALGSAIYHFMNTTPKTTWLQNHYFILEVEWALFFIFTAEVNQKSNVVVSTVYQIYSITFSNHKNIIRFLLFFLYICFILLMFQREI